MPLLVTSTVVKSKRVIKKQRLSIPQPSSGTAEETSIVLPYCPI